MLFNALQRGLDVLILLFITWLLHFIYQPTELFRMLGIYGSILLALVFHFAKVYRSWRGTKIVFQIQHLLLSWFLVIIFFNSLVLVLCTPDQFEALWPFTLLKTTVFQIWSLSIVLGLISFRVISRPLLMYFRKKGFNQRKAVIVGTGKSGFLIAKHLFENRWMGIYPVGFFDDSLPKHHRIRIPGDVSLEVKGSVSECADFTLVNDVDMVFIALPMRAEKKINRLIWRLGIRGVEVYLTPDLFTIGIQKAKIHQFCDIPLLDLNLFPAWKRFFDIIFSSLVIAATFPLWLAITIFIKLEDGGPIFFKHTRIMENGKTFGCLKFRTMHVDADKRLNVLLMENDSLRKEWEETFKLKNDPRVTIVGKILRKTSMDELPQFLNVLAGEMSVVGARPIVLEELNKYYKEIAVTYCAMKPGITGPWQTGKRNDTQDYTERVELDRSYVLNCSLWMDLKIILLTIWRVVRPRGAY
ncbi:MAG: sugar transferase [Desulfobacterales bacterium]